MYWFILIYYNNKGESTYQGRTCHIVRAKSKKVALCIREKYGISYPMNSERVRKVECIKIDSRLKINKIRLHYKRLHAGGSIWYEENNQLKTEDGKNKI